MTEVREWGQVGERVRDARIGAGLSQAELGAALSLDRTMIAKIEAGTRKVDALELTRLAAALDVPLDYFLHSAPPVLSRRAELSEDTATDAGRQAFRLEARLEAWARDVQQLIDLGTLSRRTPYRYEGVVATEDDARRVALQIRRDADLALEPIHTVMDLCEKAGQYVLVTDLPGDGASMVVGDDLAVAVVSRSVDPGRRRATAAHELGHMVLGDPYSNDIGVHASLRDREAVVDAFAAELLLPSDVVAKVNGRQELVELAARYRTSWSLATRQAQLVEVVDAAEARRLRQRTPTKAELMDAVGWAPQPDLDSVRVPRDYAKAVMEAWKRDMLTSSRVVELMHGQVVESDLPVVPDDEVAP
ncbi:XRE family transcriptional regulator [Lentzea sp.]|uniref:helix-turn-helix domain-containing protein n=1 Tax=Lentzea sp. TaxID=56099 RepID=UPI002B732C07|nr:XRE family transcriptional regulator [Lentzea sp.]HUQ56567.1 XRE family transcriptional regulator [Lentzea sp.]